MTPKEVLCAKPTRRGVGDELNQHFLAQPDRQNNQGNRLRLQAALQGQCGLIVQPFTQPLLRREDQLVRETHAVGELIDGFLRQLGQFLHRIGTVSNRVTEYRSNFAQKAWIWQWHHPPFFACFTQCSFRAHGFCIDPDRADQMNVGETTGKQALYPEERVDRRPPVIG